MRRWIYFLPFLVFALFSSCTEDIPEEDVFDNPLDEGEVVYETPALTLFPLLMEPSVGSNFMVQVFVLEVENVAGGFVRLKYNKSKLQVLSVNPGQFFIDNSQDPIFISEDNTQESWIDIHTSFLGSDSVAVSGTGSLAEIVFTSLSAGSSSLNFDSACELVDPADNTIQIRGFGQGVVNAQ